MTKAVYIVRVETELLVSADASAFTSEFMHEFKQHFYPFNSFLDHISHLGWLYATGRVDSFTSFVEGYGDPKDFGITFSEMSTETTVSKRFEEHLINGGLDYD